MQKDAFALLNDLEKSWWYRGRARVVDGILAHVPDFSSDILDFGAGHGGMHPHLFKWGKVFAYEPDRDAQKNTLKRQYAEVFSSEESAFSRHYSVIGLFDVLEHIDDDAGFLLRARSAVAEGGRLAITVPAMPFLWSTHDVRHHHFRRYTMRTLKDSLREGGFEPIRISYWNAVSFLPAVAARLFGRSGESAFSLPPKLDAALYTCVAAEAAFIRKVPLLLGLSLVALAKKA